MQTSRVTFWGSLLLVALAAASLRGEPLDLDTLLGRYRMSPGALFVANARVADGDQTLVPARRGTGSGTFVVKAADQSRSGETLRITSFLTGEVSLADGGRARVAGGYSAKAEGRTGQVGGDAWLGLGGLGLDLALGGTVTRSRHALTIRNARYRYRFSPGAGERVGRVDVKITVRLRTGNRARALRIQHVAYLDAEGKIPAMRMTATALRSR